MQAARFRSALREHDIGTPDLAGWEARSDEEHASMREREPVHIATQRVLAEGLYNQSQIDQMLEEIAIEIAAVEAFADSSDIARPSVEALLDDVFAP
jgi:TPP-dependent pyruvate/acetoin dehydrogenase alpha subunit